MSFLTGENKFPSTKWSNYIYIVFYGIFLVGTLFFSIRFAKLKIFFLSNMLCFWRLESIQEKRSCQHIHEDWREEPATKSFISLGLYQNSIPQTNFEFITKSWQSGANVISSPVKTRCYLYSKFFYSAKFVFVCVCMYFQRYFISSPHLQFPILIFQWINLKLLQPWFVQINFM